MFLRIRVFSAAFLCVLMTVHTHAQTAGRSSLSDLVQSAFVRNREFLAARQHLTEAQGLLRQAGVRPNPTLEVEGGTGRPLGTVGEEEYSAGYFQPIELGGKRSKRVAVAEAAVKLAEAELAERTRQLTFEVKNKAIEAIADGEKSKALARLADVNQQAYKLTEARVKEGDAARLDAQLLLVEQSRTEAQQATITGRYEANLIELRRVIGLTETDAMSPGDTLQADNREPSLATLQELALKQRPDLRTGHLLEEQGGAEVTLAQAQSRPDVTLSARYVHRNAQFDDQYGFTGSGTRTLLRDQDNVVLFGASIPIFTGKRNQGNIEAASARATGSTLRRQHLAATIPLDVQAASRRWKATKATLAIFDRGVLGQSEQNLQIIRQAYQLGQLRLLDVLNEQRRLTDIELSYIDAKADFLRALIELERAIAGDLP